MNAMTVLPNISNGMWEVIIVLRSQVELARIDKLLCQGQLKYFRKALLMKSFQDVVERVLRIVGFSIFSTMREIELMEYAIINNDRTEVTVQCCVILQLCECIQYREEPFSDPRREHSWLFAPHKSLEEIAYLRSRLYFIRYASYAWSAMSYSMIRAIDKCFRDIDNPPTWQGMLLIFKESGPFYSHHFLTFLIRTIGLMSGEMPKDAATLFLSFAADAILNITAQFENELNVEEVGLIETLLQLGASPMISREHHHVLFKRLGDSIHTGRPPWWTAAECMTTDSTSRYPTALSRLLSYDWSPEFSEKLAQYTCCSLDATESLKENFKSTKVPELRCLAAQNLRESDLEALSASHKFIAAKHRPHSFAHYFRRL